MTITLEDAERILEHATDRINYTCIHGTYGEHLHATDDYERARKQLAEVRYDLARERFEKAYLERGGDSYVEGQAVMAALADLDAVR